MDIDCFYKWGVYRWLASMIEYKRDLLDHGGGLHSTKNHSGLICFQ